MLLDTRDWHDLELDKVREFHNSPNAMARVLVQYMPCDKQVHREVNAHYDNAPTLETIATMRARHKRAISNHQREHDSSVVWMDERYTNNMEAASKRLALAIIKARAA